MATQWLGLCAFTAEEKGSIPGQETKTPHAIWCHPKFKSNKNVPCKHFLGPSNKSKCIFHPQYLAVVWLLWFITVPGWRHFGAGGVHEGTCPWDAAEGDAHGHSPYHMKVQGSYLPERPAQGNLAPSQMYLGGKKVPVLSSCYKIIWETNCQSRFNAGYRKLGAGALGWPRGMEWGGKWEGGSGLWTRVHPWRIHVDVWQNQYNIVK